MDRRGEKAGSCLDRQRHVCFAEAPRVVTLLVPCTTQMVETPRVLLPGRSVNYQPQEPPDHLVLTWPDQGAIPESGK